MDSPWSEEPTGGWSPVVYRNLITIQPLQIGVQVTSLTRNGELAGITKRVEWPVATSTFLASTGTAAHRARVWISFFIAVYWFLHFRSSKVLSCDKLICFETDGLAANFRSFIICIFSLIFSYLHWLVLSDGNMSSTWSTLEFAMRPYDSLYIQVGLRA